jgi:sugar phosphate isomerase/epimerase
MQVVENFQYNFQNMQEFSMTSKLKFANISLSAYAFGYGCGFVTDSRDEASGVQNMSLDDLTAIAKNNELGGVEIPIDKYFKDKSIEDLALYVNNLKKSNLRLIYAFENFDSIYFSQIAPFIRRNYSDFIRVKISNFYGGNRFKEEMYKNDINKFREEIKKSIKVIDEFGIKILIENHQDITLKDIFDLVDEFSSNRIGVNWDTGNSFPTGETIESFLEKSIHLIGNVHLKDYRIQTTSNGYIMHRCALGEGVVDFKYLLSTLNKYNSRIPLTIELGAMNGREAMINNELYWTHTEGVSKEGRINLVDFINTHAENDKLISTLWERKSSPEFIFESEYTEVLNSINYIKNIIKGL